MPADQPPLEALDFPIGDHDIAALALTDTVLAHCRAHGYKEPEAFDEAGAIAHLLADVEGCWVRAQHSIVLPYREATGEGFVVSLGWLVAECTSYSPWTDVVPSRAQITAVIVILCSGRLPSILPPPFEF